MANEIQVFDFEQREVRIVMKDGEPWWVAKDVCDVLELSDSHTAIRNLDEDEKGRQSLPTPGGEQEMSVINESGLYTLIMRSSKPEAKRFRKWVTSVVLPAIRKDGSYSINGIPHKDNRDAELEIQAKKADAQLRNANARLVKEFRQMMEAPSIPMTDESKQILAREIARMVTGQPLVQMLPDSTEKLYNAKEVGDALGISNRQVHKIAKELGIRAPEGERNEFGLWKMTKSPYSPHECVQWVMTEAGRQKIAEAVNSAEEAV